MACLGHDNVLTLLQSESQKIQLSSLSLELDEGLWILTHDDLRYVARVRTFIDFVACAIAPHRELLEGRKRSCELGGG